MNGLTGLETPTNVFSRRKVTQTHNQDDLRRQFLESRPLSQRQPTGGAWSILSPFLPHADRHPEPHTRSINEIVPDPFIRASVIPEIPLHEVQSSHLDESIESMESSKLFANTVKDEGESLFASSIGGKSSVFTFQHYHPPPLLGPPQSNLPLPQNQTDSKRDQPSNRITRFL